MTNRYYLDMAENGRIVCRYDALINGNDIPKTARPVTHSVFEQTLARQPGVPYLTHADKVEFRTVDAYATEEQAARQERGWRDGEVEAVKWLRERHRDEMDLAITTTLTTAQFKSLLTYLQALRNWPQSPSFPDLLQRPVAPGWIATQKQ